MKISLVLMNKIPPEKEIVVDIYGNIMNMSAMVISSIVVFRLLLCLPCISLAIL